MGSCNQGPRQLQYGSDSGSCDTEKTPHRHVKGRASWQCAILFQLWNEDYHQQLSTPLSSRYRNAGS